MSHILIYAPYLFIPLLLAVIKLVCLLVAIAYYTLAERKVMAAFQRRVGPNVVGPLGLLQPLADGLKLAGKEFIIPAYASSRIFLVSAMATLLLALVAWTVIPLNLFDYSTRLQPATVVQVLWRTSLKSKWPQGNSPEDVWLKTLIMDEELDAICMRFIGTTDTSLPMPPGYWDAPDEL